MAETDPLSFDLIEALSGISYPEETFPIYFDSKAAHEVTKLNREMDAADPTTEEFKDLEKEFTGLVEQFQESEYKITIRGISREHYSDALTTLAKEVSARKPESRIDLELFMEERQEQLMWAQHIVKIEDPQGRVRAPITNEEATALYNRLPDPARDEITRQVETMNARTASGYEIGITDFDFLSEPSPEE